MDIEINIIAIEDIKKATTIGEEVNSKTTKTMRSQSTKMKEATCCMIIMAIQLIHLKTLMQPLQFIIQAWRGTENMVKDKDSIQDYKEDITGNKNTAEYQGSNHTRVMDPAKEKEHNMIQETMLQTMDLEDIAWSARNKDISHYFTVQSYHNTFP